MNLLYLDIVDDNKQMSLTVGVDREKIEDFIERTNRLSDIEFDWVVTNLGGFIPCNMIGDIYLNTTDGKVLQPINVYATYKPNGESLLLEACGLKGYFSIPHIRKEIEKCTD